MPAGKTVDQLTPQEIEALPLKHWVVLESGALRDGVIDLMCPSLGAQQVRATAASTGDFNTVTFSYNGMHLIVVNAVAFDFAPPVTT